MAGTFSGVSRATKTARPCRRSRRVSPHTQMNFRINPKTRNPMCSMFVDVPYMGSRRGPILNIFQRVPSPRLALKPKCLNPQSPKSAKPRPHTLNHFLEFWECLLALRFSTGSPYPPKPETLNLDPPGGVFGFRFYLGPYCPLSLRWNWGIRVLLWPVKVWVMFGVWGLGLYTLKPNLWKPPLFFFEGSGGP